MLIQEKIAVASIVLAAAFHLGRLVVSKYCRRPPEATCGGCGCARTLEINRSLPTKPVNGSGKPEEYSRSLQ